MKGKTPPGQISSSEDLERLCLQSDPNDPSTGQGDPRGKIAKECDSKLQDKIQKKCFDKSVDLSVAFPGFDPNSGTLKDFVEVMVECEVCLYWNNIDGLDRNCDLFDDGVVNGSCGDTICGNGVLDPGEDCDDGNTMDGDGCSAVCLFECAECFDTFGLQCTGQLCSASVPCPPFNVICSAELCPAACPCCPVCGDGMCEGDETVCNCDSDCLDGCGGSCLFFVPVCGDGTCDLCAGPGESHENCPQDCPLVCVSCPP